jgi:phosphoribosyl-AMP cyclohydrolase
VLALEQIIFNDDGLIPVISQDFKTNEVLMLAWMNKESLSLTIKNKQAVYYSRSRKKLWYKGEESGHSQILKEIYMDCDNDVILLKVEQIGGIACHTGRRSCFFQKLDDHKWKNTSEIIKNPEDIYG